MLVPVKSLDSDVRTHEMARLLLERKRLLESEEWVAHEEEHRKKGDEAHLQLFSDSPNDRDVLEQPAGPVPQKVYEDGQFPVGGCDCGFVMARDGKGRIHSWNGGRDDDKGYNLSRPKYDVESENRSGYSSGKNVNVLYK